jgi:hypothetical protein
MNRPDTAEGGRICDSATEYRRRINPAHFSVNGNRRHALAAILITIPSVFIGKCLPWTASLSSFDT